MHTLCGQVSMRKSQHLKNSDLHPIGKVCPRTYVDALRHPSQRGGLNFKSGHAMKIDALEQHAFTADQFRYARSRTTAQGVVHHKDVTASAQKQNVACFQFGTGLAHYDLKVCDPASTCPLMRPRTVPPVMGMMRRLP